MSKSDAAAAEPDALTELLERRNQVQGWLARLDELTPDTAAHVANRVRADYEERLASVLAELGKHLDGIRADVDRLRNELEDARARQESAVDELEETRLRYRIGELQEEDWAERHAALEAEVATVSAARDETSAELQRLEELVAQIDGSGEQPGEDDTLAEPFLDSASLAASDPLPAEVTAEAPAPTQPAPGGRNFPWETATSGIDPTVREIDLDAAPPAADFLDEVDRVLQEDPLQPGYTLTEEELDTRPKPGVKCPDCGYTNDAQAWYCGVCGADLN